MGVAQINQEPPPKYETLESDNDEVVYMNEKRKANKERVAIVDEMEKTAKIVFSLPVPRPPVKTSAEDSKSSSDTAKSHSTVAVQTEPIPTHTIRRMGGVLNLKGATNGEQRPADLGKDNIETATVTPASEYSGGPCPNDDKDPKRKRTLSLKIIKRKCTMNFVFSHSKNVSADATSIKSIVIPTSSKDKGKVKSSSASMFNMSTTTHTTASEDLASTRTGNKLKKVIPKLPNLFARLSPPMARRTASIEHKNDDSIGEGSASMSGITTEVLKAGRCPKT